MQGTTSLLLDQSNSYIELAVMMSSGHFDVGEGNKSLDVLSEQSKEHQKIRFDPAYLGIRNLLPKALAESLHSQLIDTQSAMMNYRASLIGLNPLDPDKDLARRNSSNRAIAISQQLLASAGTLAESLAYLDIILASGQTPKATKKKR